MKTCVAGDCCCLSDDVCGVDDEVEEELEDEEGESGVERPVMSGHDGGGRSGLASMDWGGAFIARVT